MSIQSTAQRLVFGFLLLSLFNTLIGLNALVAQETNEDPCTTAEPLALNETFLSTGSDSSSSDVYSLDLPRSGVLSLFASTPSRSAGDGLPKISLVETKCEDNLHSSTEYRLIGQTPQSLQIEARSAQVIRFSVMPENPETTLGPYKLRVAFAQAADMPDATVSLEVNPPESCDVLNAPVFGESPFQANRFVVVERDLDMLRDVEPEDCDILDGLIASPGVLVIEASGTPLEASFFTGSICSLPNQLAAGMLGSPDSTVAIPVHAGPYRLALDPMIGGPIAYSLSIRHFDLCSLGELDDHGSQPLCASQLEVGDTAQGTLDEVAGGDEDFFTFSLDEQRTVILDLSGEVAMAIYDQKGQRISVDSFPKERRAVKKLRVVRTLGQGRYYLSISGSPGGDTAYALTLREVGNF